MATSNKVYKQLNIMKVLGITALAILILMGVAGAAPFAYITNYDSNNVSVIDTATNKVTTTVDVGYHPAGIAVIPDGTKAYVETLYDTFYN
jgi:YVTN family beta-propeller protein